MARYFYVKAPDEAAWLAMYRDHFAHEVDGRLVARPGIDAVHVVVTHTDPAPAVEFTRADKSTFTVSTTTTVRPGYHVNLTLPDTLEPPEALRPWLVNPARPKAVHAGTYSLDAPVVLEDDGDEILITRPIGAQPSDLAKDAAEAEHVRRKIAREEREDRRALHAATLAVVEARTARDVLAAERDRIVAAVDEQRAARAALVTQREAEQAKRDAAVAALTGLTGAARAPEVAKRDAAAAELQRLAPAVVEANSTLARTTEQREEVAARLSAANVALQRLRTERAAALAAVTEGKP